jgi:uncharacterized protein YndB with AHSA1/START domain
MRVLKFVLVTLVLLAALVVGVGLMLPDEVEVQRSTVIDRPPSQVYALLNGFTRFNDWSPWAEYDETAVYALEGPATGIGARMTWQGERGGGSQQIIESVEDTEIVVALDFGSEGRAIARYRLTPEGEGTRVVWLLESDFEGSLVGRWFGLMMDDMVGADYERGLGQLKALLENSPASAVPADAEPAATDGLTPAEEPGGADEPAPDGSEPADEDDDGAAGQGAGAIAIA